MVPDITTDAAADGFEQKGARLLLNDAPYSGFTSSYFGNGRLKSKTGYFQGLKEGISILYYEDGSIREERYYLKNNKHGNHLGYWPDGAAKFSYHFQNGFLEGEAREWYQSGQPYRFFTYQKGKESGSQKMWESDGKIRANYVVKNNHRYGLIGLKNCKSVSDEKGVLTARAY